jgi:hypothetical protein
MAIIDAQDNEVFPAPRDVPTTREALENRYNRGVIIPKGSEVPDYLKDYISTGKLGGMHQEVTTNEPDKLKGNVIEPIDEHELHTEGNPVEIHNFMQRIETLEDRFNKLIIAISKSRKVKDI